MTFHNTQTPLLWRGGGVCVVTLGHRKMRLRGHTEFIHSMVFVRCYTIYVFTNYCFRDAGSAICTPFDPQVSYNVRLDSSKVTQADECSPVTCDLYTESLYVNIANSP